MLIDFSVFEVSDILEFIESDALLTDRIQEAEQLLEEMKEGNVPEEELHTVA